MVAPAWVEEALDNVAQIQEVCELKEGVLAVAQTREKLYVIRDRLMLTSQVWEASPQEFTQDVALGSALENALDPAPDEVEGWVVLKENRLAICLRKVNQASAKYTLIRNPLMFSQKTWRLSLPAYPAYITREGEELPDSSSPSEFEELNPAPGDKEQPDPDEWIDAFLDDEWSNIMHRVPSFRRFLTEKFKGKAHNIQRFLYEGIREHHLSEGHLQLLEKFIDRHWERIYPATDYGRGTPDRERPQEGGRRLADERLKLRKILKRKDLDLNDKIAHWLLRNEKARQLRMRFEEVCRQGASEPEDYVRNALSGWSYDWDSYYPQLAKLLHSDGFNIDQAELDQLADEVREDLDLSRFEDQILGVDRAGDLIHSLDTLSGGEFEDLLMNLYKRRGYQVEKTPATGDQGADLIVEKAGQRVAVQAKRYRETVGNEAVQQIVAAVSHYGADRGVVVSTSQFSSSAEELAHSNQVDLVPRHELEGQIRDHF